MRIFDTHPGAFALETFSLPTEVSERLRSDIEAAQSAAIAREKAELEAERREPAAPLATGDALEWAKRLGLKPLPDWKAQRRGRDLVRLLDPKAVDDYLAAVPSQMRSREDRERCHEIVRRVRLAGAWKRTLRPRKVWRNALNDLEANFPNFRAVIDFVRASFALAERGSRAVSWSPIVLDGPPGIGKTLFAEELGRRLDVPTRRVDLAITATAMALVGCDKHYAEAETGILFELLAFGESASPLVILDELDKASGDDRFPSTGPLYGLLEPRTAGDFRDQAVPDISLDASHVLWIATSNAADLIPEPIRSRMRIFSIAKPTREASRALARRIYLEIGRECMPGVGIPEPPAEVLDRLARLSPRSVQIVVREGFGRALYGERDAPVASDFAIPKEGRRIGF